MSKMLMVLSGNHVRYGKDPQVFENDNFIMVVSDKEMFLRELKENYTKEDRELIIKTLGLDK